MDDHFYVHELRSVEAARDNLQYTLRRVATVIHGAIMKLSTTELQTK